MASAAPAAQEIPTVQAHWLTGSAAAIRPAPHRYTAEAGLRHGGLARIRVINRRFVVCASAETARHVLVRNHENYPRSYHRFNGALVVGMGLIFNEGEDWLLRRRLVLPAFRTESVQNLCATACEETRGVLDEWETRARRGETVDTHHETKRLTLAVIGRAIISGRVDRTEAAVFAAAIQKSLHLIRARNTRPFNPPLWMPTRHNRTLREVQTTLDGFVERHLQDREAVPEDQLPDDILSHLLQIRDPATGAPLTRTELRDETKTLFGAGFETTASSLTWCLYLLAKHPEIAAAWRREVDEVLGGSEPTMDTLSQLEFTAAIVHESLRLYPPVYAVRREAVADDEIMGKRIHAGDVILVSIFGIHRDPGEWEAPDEFRPSRFLPGKPWNRDAFLPFAVGKHRCIGNTFAHIEMMVALAMIAQRFEISVPEGFTVGEDAFLSLFPDRPVPLSLHPRA